MTDDQEDPGYAPGGYPGRYPRPSRYPREGLGVVWTPERLKRLRESIEAFQERGWFMPLSALPPGHHGNMHTEPGEWRPLGFVREEDLDVKPERGPSADLEICDETVARLSVCVCRDCARGVSEDSGRLCGPCVDADCLAYCPADEAEGVPSYSYACQRQEASVLRLPHREESPVCECGHRKSGHSVGSTQFRDQCWNCRTCTGFTERAGE